MTSIQEQLKALKAQESALKAQLKKSQKKSKEELKNIADFKKYVSQYEMRPDFSQILRYLLEINEFEGGGLELFENWFSLYGKSKEKKIKKINQICDLIGGAYPTKYLNLRKGLLEEVEAEDEEEM